jgi:predicted nucleic acid-binding Zn ribbon protein
LGPLEKAQALVGKRAGDLLPSLLGNLGLEGRQAAAALVKAWPHLVEPEVAAHARPTGLRNRTLFVAVDSSAWLDEIVRYRRKDILDRLQQSFGRSLVMKISFRLA